MAGKLDSFLDREDEPDAAPNDAVADLLGDRDPRSETSVTVQEIIPEPEPQPATGEAVPHTEQQVIEDQAEPEDAAGLRKALSAERSKRNDYKGRADRLEGELAAFKARMEEMERRSAAPPAPPPQPQAAPVPFPPAPNPAEDPGGYAQWLNEKQANDRANVSEIVLRAEIGNDAEINSKIAVFQQTAAANPRLMMALRVHPDPYRYAYEQGQKIEQQRADQVRRDAVLKDLGDDPQAWITKQREAIIAEERAKLEAEYAARAPLGAPPVHLPQSLGTARSAGPRTSQVAEIPESFDDILRRRKA